MPELRWNDTEFLDFFAVEPTVEEFFLSYNYEVKREGLRLLFTVWQFESVIQVSVYRGLSEGALFTFAAYVRGECRFVNDARGRYLEFEDCIVAPSRFWYMKEGDPFNHEQFPASLSIRIGIDPDINIAIVDYLSRT
ncbi:MAG: hypothetical protein KDA44_21160 [Planctomycetales bacterium]|nr:hypothetical protein [Planctomycetales bacterium]